MLQELCETSTLNILTSTLQSPSVWLSLLFVNQYVCLNSSSFSKICYQKLPIAFRKKQTNKQQQQHEELIQQSVIIILNFFSSNAVVSHQHLLFIRIRQPSIQNLKIRDRGVTVTCAKYLQRICWLTHTNPICVRDSGEILRDKSRLPGPTIVCYFVERKMGLEKQLIQDIPSSESSQTSK